MSALVSFTVADTSRSRTSGARRGAAAAAPEGPPRQWSCYWSATGPGPVSVGCPGEPDLSLTLSPTDAEMVRQGVLAPSVAFMQGRLKTSGDNGLLLSVLAWSATVAFVPALASWSSAAQP